MRFPVKDRNTQPYMTEREIPAVKAALSAWRKLRRDKVQRVCASNVYTLAERPKDLAMTILNDMAWHLEVLSGLDERMRKEANKCKH